MWLPVGHRADRCWFSLKKSQPLGWSKFSHESITWNSCLLIQSEYLKFGWFRSLPVDIFCLQSLLKSKCPCSWCKCRWLVAYKITGLVCVFIIVGFGKKKKCTATESSGRSEANGSGLSVCMKIKVRLCYTTVVGQWSYIRHCSLRLEDIYTEWENANTVIAHPTEAAGENANGPLACPFRLADNNAESSESAAGECEFGKITLLISCLFNVTVREAFRLIVNFL